MKALKNNRILTPTCLLGTILIWQITANLVDSILLPSPKEVGLAFIELFQDGYKGTSLGMHLYASLKRLFLAFFAMLIFAIPLGLLSALNPLIRALFEPLVEFFKPLPPLGYYSILILWFGIDELSKVLLLFLAGFAPLFIASYSAAYRIPQDFIHSARNSGLNARQIFWRVIIPYSLPDILTGARIAIGSGYSALVAAEMVASKSGVGWIVLDSSKFMFIDVMFAGVILIGIAGVCMDRILVFIKQRLVHWEGKS